MLFIYFVLSRLFILYVNINLCDIPPVYYNYFLIILNIINYHQFYLVNPKNSVFWCGLNITFAYILIDKDVPRDKSNNLFKVIYILIEYETGSNIMFWV